MIPLLYSKLKVFPKTEFFPQSIFRSEINYNVYISLFSPEMISNGYDRLRKGKVEQDNFRRVNI